MEPETLRISLDTKAKVKIGEFSRRGVARGQEHVRAADHDMHPLTRCSRPPAFWKSIAIN